MSERTEDLILEMNCDASIREQEGVYGDLLIIKNVKKKVSVNQINLFNHFSPDRKSVV